jgi:uncharacterized protein
MSEATGRIARWIERYVALCFRRSGTLLIVTLVFSALALVAARRIELDTRIESLLPRDSASARAVLELRGRTTTDSPLYLLVQSSQPDVNRRLAQTLREEVAGWSDTEWAIDRRDPSFFLERRLLYLPASDLDELADRVEQIVEYEECALLPGCVNLEERPPNPTEHEIAERLRKVPEVSALASLFGSESLEGKAAETAPEALPGPEGLKRVGDLCSADGHVCAVQAILRGNPLDLEYGESVTRRVDEMFARLRPSDAPPDLLMALSGRYHDAPETQRVVIRDLAKTSTLSTVLLLAVLIPFFRGFRPLLVLGLPLVAATLLTLGGLALIHPRLNLISAFTLAVLAGVGVDFGIHLLSHYSASREESKDAPTALTKTLKHLVGPMTMAAVTTATGFLALFPARFRGFSEMGVICAGGIALAFLSYWLVGPALIAALARARDGQVPMARPFGFVAKLRRPSGAITAVVIATGLLGSLGLGWVGYRGVEFEQDFRKLQPNTSKHGIPWGRALHGTQRNPVYLMSDNTEALEAAAAQIRAEGAVGLVRDETPSLITPRSFVPPDQAERLTALARLRKAAEDAAALGPGTKALDEVMPLLKVTLPIAAGDLPSWVRGWFVEKDGRFGHLGVLFTDLSGSNVAQMELLSNRLDEYRRRFPEVRFASGVALLGEVVPSLKRDAPVILGLAILGLSLAVLLVRRSITRLIVVLVPLFLSGAISMGLIAVLDVRINFYNLLVFPLAIGMGIDGSIYVTEAVLEPSSRRDLWTAMRAVLGATLTTLAGFAALFVANNPGLVSLAKVALITMGSTLFVNLIWLPLALGATKGGRVAADRLSALPAPPREPQR